MRLIVEARALLATVQSILVSQQTVGWMTSHEYIIHAVDEAGSLRAVGSAYP